MAFRESDLVLAIDLGTESVRAGLFNAQGDLVASASVASSTTFPRPGWAEQDPCAWWEALGQAVRACMAECHAAPRRVAAIAADSTASTVLAVAAGGRPLAPAIMWMDGRATREAEDIAASGHPVLRYCGGQDSVEWMVPKALWLKRRQPETFAEAAYIVEALDWLNYRLTGRWVASICNAACKWNYVTPLGGWDPEFLAAIGLPEILDKWPSSVLPLGEIVGPLAPAAAEHLGLAPGIPVGQGGVDAHIGMLGMGVKDAGDLSLTIGSSSVHLGLVDQPAFHPGIWGPYPDAVIPGLYVIEGGQSSTGSITKWFKDEFAATEVALAAAQDINPYTLLADAASRIPAGAEGLVALDFWQGNRTPYRDPHARGVLIGLSLRHTRAHVYRAILEAVAFGTRNILDTFASSGHRFDRIVVGGGGTRNRAWLQIHADVCQQPLTTTRSPDTSLLGSAVCAAVAAGWHPNVAEAATGMTGVGETIEPDPSQASCYDFYYWKYKEAYQRLRDLMADLSQNPEDRGRG